MKKIIKKKIEKVMCHAFLDILFSVCLAMAAAQASLGFGDLLARCYEGKR